MGVNKYKQRIRRLVLTLGTRGDVSQGFPAQKIDDNVRATFKLKQRERRPVRMNDSTGDISQGFPAPGSNIGAPVLPVFSVAVVPVQAQEGNTGVTNYDFLVTSTPAPTGDIMVAWTSFAQGTYPANDQDFVGGAFPTGQYVHPSGQPTSSFRVQVQADTIYENDEEFGTQIFVDPNHASIGSAFGTGLITNDDAPPYPTFGFASTTVSQPEGNSGVTAWSLTVNRLTNTVGAASQPWHIEPDPTHPNPAQPSRFGGTTFPSGSVAFINGQPSGTIGFTTVTNTTAQPDEGFRVVLDPPTIGSIEPGQGVCQGVITNDDAASKLGTYSTYDPNIWSPERLVHPGGYAGALMRASYFDGTSVQTYDVVARTDGWQDTAAFKAWWSSQIGASYSNWATHPRLEILYLQHTTRTGNLIPIPGQNKPVIDMNCLTENGTLLPSINAYNGYTNDPYGVDLDQQTATGNGSQTNWALTQPYGGGIKAVTVGGVAKNLTTDYTLSAGHIIFNSAPANGAAIVIDYYGFSNTPLRLDAAGSITANSSNFCLAAVVDGLQNIGVASPNSPNQNALWSIAGANASTNGFTALAGNSLWNTNYGLGYKKGSATTNFPGTMQELLMNRQLIMTNSSTANQINGSTGATVNTRINGIADADHEWTHSNTGHVTQSCAAGSTWLRIGQDGIGTTNSGTMQRIACYMHVTNSLFTNAAGDFRANFEADLIALFNVRTSYDHVAHAEGSSSGGPKYRANAGCSWGNELAHQLADINLMVVSYGHNGSPIQTYEVPNKAALSATKPGSISGLKIPIFYNVRAGLNLGTPGNATDIAARAADYAAMCDQFHTDGWDRAIVASDHKTKANTTGNYTGQQTQWDTDLDAHTDIITVPSWQTAHNADVVDFRNLPHVNEYNNPLYNNDGTHLVGGRNVGAQRYWTDAVEANIRSRVAALSATIPTLQPGSSYTGMLDSGGYTIPAPQQQGTDWRKPIAAMTIPFERGTTSNANGRVPRQAQTDAYWWIEDTTDNYVSVCFKSNDPQRLGIASVTFVLEGASVTLTGNQLWTWNPQVSAYGATVRLQSKPGLVDTVNCKARLVAIIRPVNGVDRVISTVVALNSDARVTRAARYVDPTAATNGNGTIGSPWNSMEYWLNRGSSSSGVPNGGVVYCRTATPYILGTIAQATTYWTGDLPITVRAWPGEEANQIVIGHSGALAAPQDYSNGANRITARCIWKNARIYTENLSRWPKGHVFLGCNISPQTGDFNGPQSLGYSEGYMRGSPEAQGFFFEDCALIGCNLELDNPAGYHLAVNSVITFGRDAFYALDDHRAAINCTFTNPHQMEFRAHSSVNITVAAVQANTPVAGRTTITFNEPLRDTASFQTAVNNTESALRVLSGGGGVAVGNQIDSDGYNRGWFIDSTKNGSQPQNFDWVNRKVIVFGDLSAIPIGAVCRIYTPGHCDPLQAYFASPQKEWNKPIRENFLIANCDWHTHKVQAPCFIQGVEPVGQAWYNATLAGYSVTVVGTAITLNLAPDDATRPWTSSSATAAQKLRFQEVETIRINGEYRRLISADGITGTLDSPLAADVTAFTAFTLWHNFKDFGFLQMTMDVSDPGPQRGLLSSGNANIGFEYCTINANYIQILSGVAGFTVFDSVMPDLFPNSQMPREAVLKNNHYLPGRAGGGGPAVQSYDTDGLGTTGAATFDANEYPTSGITKTVGSTITVPRDLFGRQRIASHLIGAVSDPAPPV